jgi:hypothetical protein
VSGAEVVEGGVDPHLVKGAEDDAGLVDVLEDRGSGDLDGQVMADDSVTVELGGYPRSVSGDEWAGRGVVRPRASRLSLVLDQRWLRVGYMMCDGVFQQTGCGRSFFLGRPRRGRVGSDLAGS